MKSVMPMQIGANRDALLQRRAQAITQVRTHGTSRLPAGPRNLQIQQAEGGVVATWNLPTRYEDVTGYRIYLGSEKNLAMQIKDRGTRQMFIPLQSGGAPPTQNIFVSVVNGFREGPRLQKQSKPIANGSIPNVKPMPPGDYLNQFSGGLDKTQSGQPSGAKTPRILP